jgi:hypothetical protein
MTVADPRRHRSRPQPRPEGQTVSESVANAGRKDEQRGEHGHEVASRSRSMARVVDIILFSQGASNGLIDADYNFDGVINASGGMAYQVDWLSLAHARAEWLGHLPFEL